MSSLVSVTAAATTCDELTEKIIIFSVALTQTFA